MYTRAEWASNPTVCARALAYDPRVQKRMPRAAQRTHKEQRSARTSTRMSHIARA